jgi:hypothetical protein
MRAVGIAVMVALGVLVLAGVALWLFGDDDTPDHGVHHE